MISEAQARQIAYEHVNQNRCKVPELKRLNPHGDFSFYELEVVIAEMVEVECAWIYFYQTRAYIETREIRYALFGNVPVVVRKVDGALSLLPRRPGTAPAMIDDQIRYYKEQFCK